MSHIDVRITSQIASDEDAANRLGTTCRRLIDANHDGAMRHQIEERLQLELTAFKRLGISGLFLEQGAIAADLTEQGHEIRVVGAAAGSVVLYALGLSKVCPLQYGLLFERFIDADLETFPAEGLSPGCVASQHANETLKALKRRGYEFHTVDHRAEVNGEQKHRQRIKAVLPEANSTMPHLTLRIAGPSVISPITVSSIETRSEDWLRDKATFDLLARGATDGILGLCHPQMQDALRRVKPQSLAGLAAVMAIGGQPNVCRRMLFDRYVACAENDQPKGGITKPLSRTRGVLLYQEDLMQILHESAGFTLWDAYDFVRDVCKRRLDRISEARRKFISRTSESGLEREWAEQIFDLFEDRAVHILCKAHCFATAYNCCEAAYIKAHHPDEFQAVVVAMTG